MCGKDFSFLAAAGSIQVVSKKIARLPHRSGLGTGFGGVGGVGA